MADKYFPKGKNNRIEYDISQIDQDIFDDPIKLLDYLESNDITTKSTVTKRASESYKEQKELTNEQKTNEHKSVYPQNTIKTEIYGYKYINGRMRINPDEAAAVKAIFAYSDSGLNPERIQDEMYYTKYRNSYGNHFYSETIRKILNNRKVYEGLTGYPAILTIKTSAYKSNHISADLDTKQREIAKSHTLQIIEYTLKENKDGLSLYEIQDKSGIDNLDDINEALEKLRLSGKVERSWSRRHGGRTIYIINDLVNSTENAIVKTETKFKECSVTNITASFQVKNEVLRVLRLIDYPISIDNLQRRSTKLGSVDRDTIQTILLDLRKSNRLSEYTCNNGRTVLYSLNNETKNEHSNTSELWVEYEKNENVSNHISDKSIQKDNNIIEVGKVDEKRENRIEDKPPKDSLHELLLNTLKSQNGYLSLSELYVIEPSLKKYSRSKIIATLIDLLHENEIMRILEQNKLGAMVLKYRLKI